MKSSRFRHFLKRNHGCTTLHHVASIDTETTQTTAVNGDIHHSLQLGCIASSIRLQSGNWSAEKYHDFDTMFSAYDQIERLAKPKSTLFLIAHNWSFDAQILDVFGEFPRRGWTMGLCVIDGPPWIVKWKRGKQTVVMLDSMNYWPTKLSLIGESVGIQKGSWETEKHDLESLRSYCRTDTLIPLKAMQKLADFIRDNDYGGFASTAAGQAMRTYRHRFMKHDILIDTDEKALKLARNSYYGGRVECHYIGKLNQQLYIYDVNSMYPWVMANNVFPARLRSVYRDVSNDELTSILTKYTVCAEVEIETDLPAYPLQMDGRLTFPVGRFRTFLSTPEIQFALDNGHLIHTNQAAIYESEPLFKDYVEHFYALKLAADANGDKLTVGFLKLFLNSLYGKFGQNGRTWETIAECSPNEIGVWDEICAQTEVVTRYRALGGQIQQMQQFPDSRDAHPAIAGHTTAYSRIELFKLWQLAGFENGYYMDTDCLLVNETGKENLAGKINPRSLGGLKLEKSALEATLYGPKDYRFGSITKLKGISDKAILDEFGSYHQHSWRSLSGAIRAGKTNQMVVRPIVKTLAREYLKGDVTESGRVLPFKINTL